MKDIKFSVVIPTKNRAKTLKYCLKTCLNQNYDNYEIIVSDNNSIDNTKEIVDSFNSDKIKYFKTDEPLFMTHNFEFAISKISGEYVIVLGDDDALHFHSLNLLNELINITNFKVIRWELNNYAWPDYLLPDLANYTLLRKVGKARIVNGMDVIKKVVNFEVRYHHMPMLYMNSVVSVDIINKLYNKTKKIFDSCSPDVYSGFVISGLCKEFLSIDFPLSVGGSSGKSNGMAHVSLIDKNEVAKDFNELIKKVQFEKKYIFPDIIGSESVAVEDAFNYFCENLAIKDKSLFLNYKKYILKVVEEIKGCCGYNFNGKGKVNFNESISYMYTSLNNNVELKKWFEENILGNYIKNNELKYYDFSKKFIPNMRDNLIEIDASRFGIKDIYEVAELAENLLAYTDKTKEYMKKWNKVKKAIDKICNNLSNENIGIYGTGGHAEIIVNLINYFYSDKSIKFYFFDSSKSKMSSNFLGNTVYSPEDINDLELDKIVIASYTYQDEIYDTLKLLLDDSNNIIKLYEEDEEFYFDILA